MQNKNNYNVIKRGETYASYIANDSLKNGDNYSDLPKIIVVWILSFDLFKDDGPYHEESLTVRAYNSEILSDNFKYHFFQLPKFIKNVKEIKTPEEQWLTYLSCQLNNIELEELFKMNRSIEEIDKIVDEKRDTPQIQQMKKFHLLDLGSVPFYNNRPQIFSFII